jgi:hypothetical protein
MWLAVLSGAAVGLAVCVALQWPPWDPPNSGDALMGSYHLLMRASHPLYLLTGDVASALGDVTNSAKVERALLNVQVVLNLVLLSLGAFAVGRLAARGLARFRG